ncbi:N-acetyltransferase [Pedobacter nutrimenti]|uniref:N-acetyltransferase n=1 Tax=Pedobacter nutrimenti TaxID=1241337 RepID=UPI002930510E|nr:N-acetyltransferase [Pedobacter nutrimenti]
MSAKIITKFTVATADGIENLMGLGRKLAKEKFQNLVREEVLEKYVSENFAEKVLIEEVNSLSNQWLIVYADEKPAGYARITSKGLRPASVASKKAIRIADFGILQSHAEAGVLDSLYEKCLQVCKAYDAVWLNEFTDNILLDFFIRNGFEKQDNKLQLDDLPISSVYLVKMNR